MTTPTRQLTDLERAVRRARHVVRNPAANWALDAKYVAPLVAEFDRREDEIDRRTVESIRLLAQRDAILALHPRREVGEQATCGHCSVAGLRGDVAVQLAVTLWPCPTVQALGGAA